MSTSAGDHHSPQFPNYMEFAGRISGIHNTFASLGALPLPLMLGYVRDVTSTYGLGLIIISILMFLGALSAALGSENWSLDRPNALCVIHGRSRDLLG